MSIHIYFYIFSVSYTCAWACVYMYVYMSMCMSVCVSICVSLCSACKDQKKLVGSIHKEFQVIISYSVWVLETKAGSFGRAKLALKC